MRTILRYAATVLLCCPALLPAQRPPTRKIVFPSGPDPARIQYTGSLVSEADIGFGRSVFSRLRTSVTGETSRLGAALKAPHDVYVDPQGRWWVTDMGRRQVLRFDPKRKEGRVVAMGRSDEETVITPMGIAGDSRGFIYVADGIRHRVAVLDTAGKVVGLIGKGELLNPTDVAWDEKRNRLYVSDSWLHQVVVFNTEPKVVARIGKQVVGAAGIAAASRRIDTTPRGHGAAAQLPSDGDGDAGRASSDLVEHRGSAQGEFQYPAFIAVAPNGHLYVSDAMNFRVQEFDVAGAPVRAIGRLGAGPGTFTRPKGIAVDSEGNLYVADAAFSNIQIFNPNGELLLFFPDPRATDAGLSQPMGLFIDAGDRLLVADKFNGRVQFYQKLKR